MPFDIGIVNYERRGSSISDTYAAGRATALKRLRASMAQTVSGSGGATRAVIPGNGIPPPLEIAPLAYENPAFLNGPDGRLIRIVSEYLEPLARFRREQIQDTVVFFGSARFRGREEADHALELLDNTGSRQPAPSAEQPASDPTLPQERRPTCSASAPWPPWKWLATTKMRAACRTCLRSGPKPFHRASIASLLLPAVARASWKRPTAEHTKRAARQSA